LVDVALTSGTSTPTAELERRLAARVDVTMLGGFGVRVNGRAVASRHWSRRHSSALVKLLALTPGRTLHREVVLDTLWPDLTIAEAAPRLHKAAHYARKALGHRDAVVLGAAAVSLCPNDDVRVDMVQFRHLAESAVRDGDAASARAALAVHAGELLPRDLYEPWAEPHRLHLNRLYVEMLHLTEHWHLALAADPADESAHLALARRYAERGDRVEALRQLDQLDTIMREELGLEPSQHALSLRRHVAEASRRAGSIDERGTLCRDAPPSTAADPHQGCCP
jgi:DNA-binding SARP family transcriptional activator